MPVAASIGAAGSLASAGLGVFGSLTGSQQQVAAQQAALTAQESMFRKAKGALQPYYTAGNTYGGVLQSLLTPGPNQTAALSAIPGFQFAQDWGQKAVQNIGTTTGLGGNTLTAGAQYATGLAQQNFGNLINPLIALYGTGENAAGALSGAATNFSSQLGQTLTGIGQSQAAGTLGATNALSTGLTGGANAYMNASLLSKLLPSDYAAYGGISPAAGGVYGGSSAAPLPGLTADDYGYGY